MDSQPTLSDLETLARRAGEIIRGGFIRRPGFERAHQVDYKGEIDPVTEMDRRSEAFLLGEIKEHFPAHQIVAEESGTLSGDDCCKWYVDPLDGTVNYAHGIPIFSVSIAFAENEDLSLGVVYDPIQDECFSAQRGSGARLNGQPLRVSTTESLDRSLLVTGFPYDIRTNPENNLDHYARFALRTQGVRRLGSAALDLCYVAAGRFDGFWEFRLSPWDLAAGGLIAREAGALVTDMQGGPNFLSAPYSLIAANPSIHTQILKVIRDA
jgi:myo-inositol-1(or 4)-monophosphatase